MDQDGRAGLTRRRIIQTALRLLDEVGLDGLTVRRIAAELGVRSPALYWHFRNKQDLLDGIADQIVLAAGMGPPHDGESWQEWLARRARAYRRSLLDHRDGARVIANAAWLSPATIRTFDQELTAMVARGFTPVLALRTITAIAQYVNGFVLQEQTARRDATAAAAEGLAGLAGFLDAGEDATLVVALRDGGNLGEEAFEQGLRALIEGTAAARTGRRDHP